MTRQAQSIHEFGPYRIDAARRLLLRDGGVVPLTPKCFDILRALVESSGEVVYKDELMKRVWPDSFVEEGNLTYNISMLRKALGERASEHQYIVTVPGCGYKFVASVSEACLDGAREAVQELNDASKRKEKEQEQVETEPQRQKETILSILSEIKRNKVLAVLTSTIVFLAVAVIGYMLYRLVGQDKPATPFRAMKVTPLTDSGKVHDAAISPDGKSVVYTLYENDKSSLWLKNLSTGSEIQILAPAEAGCDGLTFSTDCNYIYFRGDDSHQPKAALYQIPVFGGAVRKLIVGIDSPITLSPNGSRLAFVRNDETRGESALMMANADGTGQQTLATRKGPDSFGGWPTWSPDGKVIACPVWSPPGDNHGHMYNVIEVRVADGTEKPLSYQWWGRVAGLRWLSDGSGLVMITGESVQPGQIWRLSYPDGEAQRITNDTSDYWNPSLTADSSVLVVTRREYPNSIWITAPNVDTNQANPITLGANKSDGGLGIGWTPDGKILYTTSVNENWHIWIMDADGSNRKQVTFGPQLDGTPVTPDGRYVVFPSERTGNGLQIWRMNIDGSNLKQLTYGKHDEEPQCSPDGKWVVYGSPDSGKSTLWKVSIDGGNPLQLTDKAVKPPAAISPDGKLIAYLFLDEQVKPQQWKIAVIPFEGGEPIKVFGTSPTFDSRVAIRWTPDGRALAYCASQVLTANIWIQPLDGRQSKQLTDFKADLILQYEWSRDGKELAITRSICTSDIVMISGIN